MLPHQHRQEVQPRLQIAQPRPTRPNAGRILRQLDAAYRPSSAAPVPGSPKGIPLHHQPDPPTAPTPVFAPIPVSQNLVPAAGSCSVQEKVPLMLSAADLHLQMPPTPDTWGGQGYVSDKLIVRSPDHLYAAPSPVSTLRSYGDERESTYDGDMDDNDMNSDDDRSTIVSRFTASPGAFDHDARGENAFQPGDVPGLTYSNSNSSRTSTVVTPLPSAQTHLPSIVLDQSYLLDPTQASREFKRLRSSYCASSSRR